MNNKISGEMSGKPILQVSNKEEIICSLSEYIQLDYEKVKFFTENFGLSWIDNPSIVGVTDKQIAKINEIKFILGRI